MDSFADMAPRIDPPSSLLRMGPAELKAKSQAETLILAEDAGALVGCLFVRLEPGRAYIGKLAVAEAHRGQGIARRLVEHAEAIALREGRNALELQTRVELVENHATFGHLGFVKSGETAHAGYDRPTSITMRKSLAASAVDAGSDIERRSA